MQADAMKQPPAPSFPEELTPIGVQLVIPGCEKVPPKNDKPVQLGLW